MHIYIYIGYTETPAVICIWAPMARESDDAARARFATNHRFTAIVIENAIVS